MSRRRLVHLGIAIAAALAIVRVVITPSGRLDGAVTARAGKRGRLVPLAIAAGTAGLAIAGGAVAQTEQQAQRAAPTPAPAECVTPNATPAGDVLIGGEAPIQETGPNSLEDLALHYQPTVVVSELDRFWPVSFLNVLRLRWKGATTQLLSNGRHIPLPKVIDLKPSASKNDYLDYPAPVSSVQEEFVSAAQALGVPNSAITGWRENPALLDPCPSAQIYFYYQSRLKIGSYGLQRRLLSLQYWFFYPFNYFPLLPIVTVANRLLFDPIDPKTPYWDYHQGDLEHVAVLLDPDTKAPLYLWMARHASDEGFLYRWRDARVEWDGDHPVVYAALGSHASYARCGIQPRSKTFFVFNDYVLCIPGLMFRFGYKTTPLVDLARTPWACWPGYFGKADDGLRRVAPIPKRIPFRIRKLVRKLAGDYETDGPRSPLYQQEKGSPAC